MKCRCGKICKKNITGLCPDCQNSFLRKCPKCGMSNIGLCLECYAKYDNQTLRPFQDLLDFYNPSLSNFAAYTEKNYSNLGDYPELTQQLIEAEEEAKK